MTRLSVNINKVATIRNARGGNNPDILHFAKVCEQFGAQGITVHPRPDERHIRYNDVRDLSQRVTTEFNIEGYPSPSFVRLVLEVKPTQVTLVPDSPEQLTSNHGWDTLAHASFLEGMVRIFHDAGIRTSIFVDAKETLISAAADTGTDRVELYTEPYASLYEDSPEMAVRPFIEAAGYAKSCGLGVNAGHDLNLKNLKYFHEQIPFLAEVSIGHALICDALYRGIQKTIEGYLSCLK